MSTVQLKFISHHGEKESLGSEAKCSVFVNCLHSAKTIKETLVILQYNEHLYNLVAVQEKNQIINRKNQPYIIFCHEQFDGSNFGV